MPIKHDLEEALKIAMRSNDATAKTAIRMALSNIKLAEIERGAALDDANVTAILQKEIKSRKEAIQDAQKAGRNDLILAANVEITIIEKFLPKQLSDDEITTLAKQTIEEISASTAGDFGRVMKILMPRLQGKASGDKVSSIVRSLLCD